MGDRTTFEALRRDGVRVRRGHLAAVHLPGGDDAHPRVAYAMTKRLGSAVVRNRLRRRLRALMEIEASSGRVPGGATLISAVPAAVALDGPQLANEVHRLLDALANRLNGSVDR